MNFDQIREFAPQILRIAKEHGILRVYVIGSVARSETTPQSDVDFLVELQEGASLFGMAGFCYEAERLLQIPVDVVPMSLLPQLKDRDFVKNIQRDAIAL